MRNRYICFIFFLLALNSVVAQQEAQISQYWALPGYINPAALSLNDRLTVSALDRMQWTGIPNAPKTFFVTAETPFKLMKKKHSAGIIVVSDRAGLFANTDFALQYAFRLKLWQGELSLGLRVGFTSQSFDGTKVDIPDSPEHVGSSGDIPTTNVSAMGFDAGVGAFYYHPRFYAGLSASHLTQSELELDEKSFIQLKRVYYFTAGGNIPLRNPLYELHPSVLVKSTFQNTQFDMTMRLMYNKMFWGGISYRWNDAVVLMAGAEIKGIRFGYAYDIGTSPIAKASNGSHEIFAAYALKIDFSPKSKNKHKSIRIL
ncbi:MAG: PorP/SprF family type IX secretion system membrane protein [Bacteroidales bacterium]